MNVWDKMVEKVVNAEAKAGLKPLFETKKNRFQVPKKIQAIGQKKQK